MSGAGEARFGDTRTTSGVENAFPALPALAASSADPRGVTSGEEPVFLPTIDDRVGFEGCVLAEEEEEEEEAVAGRRSGSGAC